MSGRIVKVGDEGLWGLHSQFNSDLVLACKQIPGLKWKGARKLWVGYRDAMWLLVEEGKRIGIRIEYDALLTPPDTGEFQSSLPLRPYQKEAVQFLHQQGREGCLLGDVMGLGKTLSALAALDSLPGVLKAIVVCPSS